MLLWKTRWEPHPETEPLALEPAGSQTAPLMRQVSALLRHIGSEGPLTRARQRGCSRHSPATHCGLPSRKYSLAESWGTLCVTAPLKGSLRGPASGRLHETPGQEPVPPCGTNPFLACRLPARHVLSIVLGDRPPSAGCGAHSCDGWPPLETGCIHRCWRGSPACAHQPGSARLPSAFSLHILSGWEFGED